MFFQNTIFHMYLKCITHSQLSVSVVVQRGFHLDLFIFHNGVGQVHVEEIFFEDSYIEGLCYTHSCVRGHSNSLYGPACD